MAKDKNVTKHGPRKGEIAKASRIQDFKPDDNTTLVGRNIVMDNGDSFSYWRPDRDRKSVEKLKKGVQIQYKFETEEKDGKTKSKLKAYRILRSEKNKEAGIVESKREEAEGRIVEEINDTVSFASSYAKDIMVAEIAAGQTWSSKKFETRFKSIYNTMRNTLLNETYEKDGKE